MKTLLPFSDSIFLVCRHKRDIPAAIAQQSGDSQPANQIIEVRSSEVAVENYYVRLDYSWPIEEDIGEQPPQAYR